MDRQLRHALVLARDTECLLFNLVPNFGKVDESLFEMEKLAPFVAAGGVDQLEDKRAARHDTLTAREEVAPDDASKIIKIISVREEKRKKEEEITFQVR
jgi:hypothetical protein